MKKLALTLSVVVAIATLGCVSGSAEDFNFSFAGASDSGSGIFTASATSTPGEYLVTGISGVTDGFAITALLPPLSFPGTVAPNDNLLFSPASTAGNPPGSPASLVDLQGVSYVANGTDYNLYFGQDFAGDPFAYHITFGPDGDVDDLLASFTVAVATTVSPTPEPSTLILLVTAALGLGWAVRRRRVGTAFGV